MKLAHARSVQQVGRICDIFSDNTSAGCVEDDQHISSCRNCAKRPVTTLEYGHGVHSSAGIVCHAQSRQCEAALWLLLTLAEPTDYNASDAAQHQESTYALEP